MFNHPELCMCVYEWDCVPVSVQFSFKLKSLVNYMKWGQNRSRHSWSQWWMTASKWRHPHLRSKRWSSSREGCAGQLDWWSVDTFLMSRATPQQPHSQQPTPPTHRYYWLLSSPPLGSQQDRISMEALSGGGKHETENEGSILMISA